MEQQLNKAVIISADINIKQSIKLIQVQLREMKIIEIIGIQQGSQKAIEISEKLVFDGKASYLRVVTEEIQEKNIKKYAIIIKLSFIQQQNNQDKKNDKQSQIYSQRNKNYRKTYHNKTNRN